MTFATPKEKELHDELMKLYGMFREEGREAERLRRALKQIAAFDDPTEAPMARMAERALERRSARLKARRSR